MCFILKKKYNKILSDLEEYKRHFSELSYMNDELLKRFQECKAEKEAMEASYKVILQEKNNSIDNLINKISLIEDKMKEMLNNFNK